MCDKKDGLAISFWTSLAGVALAVIAASVFLVWGRRGFVGWLLFAATPTFFSLQISSITAGVVEYKSKSGVVAVAISIASIGLVFGMAWFEPARYIFSSLFSWGLLVAVPVVSILAGATAVDVKNGRSKALKPMVIIWLMGVILVGWPLVRLLLDAPGGSPGEIPTVLYSLLLGPWTMVLMVDNFREVGFSFQLSFSLGVTVAIVSVSVLALRAKSPRRAGILVIVFAAILLYWLRMSAIGLILWGRQLG